ncbi:hypothetical protein AMS68_002697 [Peltaster fructicola]|uniref:PPM-type phosphatase domain-containing protein n=1 Tax=Peltaster fructicola TaxID=286661 RepID=A0A6H0XRT4_9PEZI|nr:hypothetical protein AMS68_002697 [Peltaster fructicola]
MNVSHHVESAQKLVEMLPRRAIVLSRRLLSHRQAYNCPRRHNSSHNEPHTTYFQQPPVQQVVRPKLRWRILRGTLIAVTSAALAVSYTTGKIITDLDQLRDVAEEVKRGLEGYGGKPVSLEERTAYERATETVFYDAEKANNVLSYGSGWSASTSAISQTCRLPANVPCEDQHVSLGFYSPHDPTRQWWIWGIFDGHAGPRTSAFLADVLPTMVGSRLIEAGALTAEHALTSEEINELIADAFVQTDEDILGQAQELLSSADKSRAFALNVASLADQGSCALVAVYDPYNKVLRVANTGDSRAVLGRWDAGQSRYVAMPMSVDQTGFNEDEVKRLEAEHPGEDIIDKSSGRLFGLAVTRAFGDSRWKFPENITSFLHQALWTSPPRPKGVVKTPPYLTARPEVKDVKIQLGAKPDFLILASDGLWDQLSTEQAVELVQMWLDKYNPKDVALTAQKLLQGPDRLATCTGDVLTPGSSPTLTSHEASNDKSDADLYYDPEEKSLRWKNKREYFTVENESCSNHLVRNALGGNRDGLFAALMSLPPTRTRDVRDDITTTVVFFGADTSGIDAERLGDAPRQD